MSNQPDGLPDPSSDPISPLLAFVCNGAVRITVAAGGFVVKGAQNLCEAGSKAMQATTAAVSKHVDNFAHKPSETPETIKVVKERMLAQEIETPSIPEHAKASALSVARAEAITKDVRDVSLQEAMGKQVVAAAMERQVQQMGLA